MSLLSCARSIHAYGNLSRTRRLILCIFLLSVFSFILLKSRTTFPGDGLFMSGVTAPGDPQRAQQMTKRVNWLEKWRKSGKRYRIGAGTHFWNGAWERDRLSGCGCVYESDHKKADIMLFHDPDLSSEEAVKNLPRRNKSNSGQLWILLTHESPYFAVEEQKTTRNGYAGLSGIFNLSASYRKTDDITIPYYDLYPKPTMAGENSESWDSGFQHKDRFALIISRDCDPQHSGRWEWVRALQRHIPVDVYGNCGKQVPDCGWGCFAKDLISRYKFYLAFEGARCRNYITEKFWRNALQAGTIPVALGGLNSAEYHQVAPADSYIHVDDFPTLVKLVQHLKKVSVSRELYERYLQWSKVYEVSETPIGCAICQAAETLFATKRGQTLDFTKGLWSTAKECTERSRKGPTT